MPADIEGRVTWREILQALKPAGSLEAPSHLTKAIATITTNDIITPLTISLSEAKARHPSKNRRLTSQTGTHRSPIKHEVLLTYPKLLVYNQTLHNVLARYNLVTRREAITRSKEPIIIKALITATLVV